MVIHDQEKEQQWAQQQQLYVQQKNKTKKTPRPISILALQSITCTILVAIALLLRLAGGAAYTKLQQGFTDALAGNELMAVLMRWWDGEPEEDTFSSVGDGGKAFAFTSSSPLV